MKEKLEEWRDIAGYEGKYQVSSLGNVRALNYHREERCQLLKPMMDGGGYQFVHLLKDGKRQMKKVHRLVAEAFLANAEGLPVVNHRDECKTHNAVSNLEWCTYEYNVNYGTRNARDAGVKSKPVQQLSLDGVLVAMWASSKEAWRQIGINHSHICECCNGKRLSAGGYKWRYV